MKHVIGLAKFARANIAVLGVSLVLSGVAEAQTAKGSPGHIKSATEAVDAASIKANGATTRDWPTATRP